VNVRQRLFGPRSARIPEPTLAPQSSGAGQH
jgi:hypothetical protein